jgi:hypothetical protein
MTVLPLTASACWTAARSVQPPPAALLTQSPLLAPMDSAPSAVVVTVNTAAPAAAGLPSRHPTRHSATNNTGRLGDDVKTGNKSSTHQTTTAIASVVSLNPDLTADAKQTVRRGDRHGARHTAQATLRAARRPTNARDELTTDATCAASVDVRPPNTSQESAPQNPCVAGVGRDEPVSCGDSSPVSRTADWPQRSNSRSKRSGRLLDTSAAG